MRLQGASDRRWIAWVAIVVLIVLVAIAAYLYFVQPI
jgi:flagellar basal body-associated protein FliL